MDWAGEAGGPVARPSDRYGDRAAAAVARGAHAVARRPVAGPAWGRWGD